MATNTPIEAARARLRLLQLVSPSLPVGAFSYSQGLEWAVEQGWIRDAGDLADWLQSTLEQSIARTDVPYLRRMYESVADADWTALEALTSQWLAWRETSELLAEEAHKGRALCHLLRDLGVPGWSDWSASAGRAFLAGFACAAAAWRIAPGEAAEAYVWGWLENQVISAVKLVPLGQTDGQRLLYRIAPSIPERVARGMVLSEAEIGAGCPALAIASSRHETQYTRLYRS